MLRAALHAAMSWEGVEPLRARAIAKHVPRTHEELEVAIGDALFVAPRGRHLVDASITVQKAEDGRFGKLPSDAGIFALECGSARVLANFTANQPGELTVQQGDDVTQLHCAEAPRDGWILASLVKADEADETNSSPRAQIGILPQVYLQKAARADDLKRSASPKRRSPLIEKTVERPQLKRSNTTLARNAALKTRRWMIDPRSSRFFRYWEMITSAALVYVAVRTLLSAEYPCRASSGTTDASISRFTEASGSSLRLSRWASSRTRRRLPTRSS